ncbi:phosphatidylinositol 4,5-bisphosphate 3-kinase catalytic subunit alpha isoform-like [Palaemon carinicauda]|uniref:phosphatidylinositol 4,5-bisphosphate 3-kinase catalytic subunit alpha isoform-like n=1 Tax=Palaemon carinicauda TaxID=392227 RepID=UPI0035B69B1B
MAPSYPELWGCLPMSTCVILDCLLPNSIILAITCHKEVTLRKLKYEIWQEAKKYPLYRILGVPENYLLVGVTQDAEQEEFWDESRRLCDLRLFSPILKVVEPRGSKEEKVLNYEISLAIGRCVHDLDDVKDNEIQHFRRKIIEVVGDAVKARQTGGLESLACYQHPPELEPSSKLPTSIEKHLDEGMRILPLYVLCIIESDTKDSCCLAVLLFNKRLGLLPIMVIECLAVGPIANDWLMTARACDRKNLVPD